MRSHARQRAELQDGPGSPLRRRGVLQERQHRGVDLVVLDHGWRPPGGFLEGSVFDPSTAVELLAVRPGVAGAALGLAQSALAAVGEDTPLFGGLHAFDGVLLVGIAGVLHVRARRAR